MKTWSPVTRISPMWSCKSQCTTKKRYQSPLPLCPFLTSSAIVDFLMIQHYRFFFSFFFFFFFVFFLAILMLGFRENSKVDCFFCSWVSGSGLQALHWSCMRTFLAGRSSRDPSPRWFNRPCYQGRYITHPFIQEIKRIQSRNLFFFVPLIVVFSLLLREIKILFKKGPYSVSILILSISVNPSMKTWTTLWGIWLHVRHLSIS